MRYHMDISVVTVTHNIAMCYHMVTVFYLRKYEAMIYKRDLAGTVSGGITQ